MTARLTEQGERKLLPDLPLTLDNLDKLSRVRFNVAQQIYVH